MADKAREWTDKKLAKMEREISLMYKKSAKDLYKKWDAYIGRGNQRIQTLEKDLRDAFKVGDEQVIAEVEERLKKAKEAFTYKNDYYKQMLNSVTYDMAQVNNDARAYINGQLPEIYAKNYAQANEIVEGMKLDFALPNENAIKARILEGKIHTPYMNTDKFVKIPKDQRWNTKFINSQVMQGIIQGEDMRTISKRIFPEINAKNGGLPERNMVSAIRNARTLVTGAENQGKSDSYKDLSERGLVLKQVWIATGDNRTRDSHLEMDGQEVDIGEPFIAINRDGTECELEYPADPNGDAEQVYNCRCALTTRVVGFRNADGTIREIEEEDEGQDLHDRQIAEEKERRMEEAEQKEQAKAEPSFAESIIDKEYSPHLHGYKTYEDYRNAKDTWEGETTKYLDDLNFEPNRKYSAETSWGIYDDKIPKIESTIVSLNEKYPMGTEGTQEYGLKLKKLAVCDYDNVWLFLPDGNNDRRLTDSASAQVFLNSDDNSAVIAFRRGTLFESLENAINQREDAIKNGEVLLDIGGGSAEGTVMHEWGHVMSNHLDNAMIYEDESAMEYWNWYDNLPKDEIRKGLSDYATTNRGEFEAECFIELQMPNPRPIARKFGEYLNAVIKKGY